MTYFHYKYNYSNFILQAIDSKSCKGGIILSALDGKVVINQTFNERLSIALYDLMPKVRELGTLSLSEGKKKRDGK